MNLCSARYLIPVHPYLSMRCETHPTFNRQTRADSHAHMQMPGESKTSAVTFRHSSTTALETNQSEPTSK